MAPGRRSLCKSTLRDPRGTFPSGRDSALQAVPRGGGLVSSPGAGDALTD